jgi:hypothetical protein
VEECDRATRTIEVVTSTPMVAQDAPCLEPGDRVFDACSAPSMMAPPAITHDSIVVEDGCDELWDATIATVGKDSSVVATQPSTREPRK